MTLRADLAFVVDDAGWIGPVGASQANVSSRADSARAQVEESGVSSLFTVYADVLQVVDGVVLNVCSSWTEFFNLGLLSTDVSSGARDGLRRATWTLVVNRAFILLEVVEFVAIEAAGAELGSDRAGGTESAVRTSDRIDSCLRAIVACGTAVTVVDALSALAGAVGASRAGNFLLSPVRAVVPSTAGSFGVSDHCFLFTNVACGT